MSNYWEYNERECEPGPEIEIEPDSAKVEIGLSINAGAIENAIYSHIEKILEGRIKRMVNKAVTEKVSKLLKNEAWSDKNLNSFMSVAIERRLNEQYPEVVQNKVNEFEKALREVKLSDRNASVSMDSLVKQAQSNLDNLNLLMKNKIQEYIESELSQEVKVTKEYLEQFSRNYFANNLFKAMGMIDKMIPETIPSGDIKND